jgi:ribosomal protein L13E
VPAATAKLWHIPCRAVPDSAACCCIAAAPLQLPFSPEYKIAPEWHPVLELVGEQHKQHLSSEQQRAAAAAQHVQLHRQVLEHALVQQLQLHTPKQQHWRGTAAAEAAAAGLTETPAKLLVGVNFPDLPEAELQRLRVDTSTFHPAAAAAADWEAPLSQLVAADGRCQHHRQLCKPELLARSRMELNVAVCPQVSCRMSSCSSPTTYSKIISSSSSSRSGSTMSFELLLSCCVLIKDALLQPAACRMASALVEAIQQAAAAHPWMATQELKAHRAAAAAACSCAGTCWSQQHST